MSTNYYRIPSESEMENRKFQLEEDVRNLRLSPEDIALNFENTDGDTIWQRNSIWSKFLDGANVHLGKRSGGWKFLWNFNDKKYYHDKKSLIEFIMPGRVVDEYGEELESGEFIKMALSWGEPDGLVYNQAYVDSLEDKHYYITTSDFDLEIDELRVSRNTDFF